MKTKVEIHDNSIISSVFFKSKISKIINSKLNEYGFENAELIEIIGVGMAKKSGYGQYQNFVRLAVNNFDWDIKSHSTDSMQYDALYNDDLSDYRLSNEFKRLCLRTIENGVDRLVDELIDNEVVFKMEVESINK